MSAVSIAPVLGKIRAVTVVGLLALIALGLVWELWLVPTGNRTLALKVLPLALSVGGVLKQRLYTYRWLSLLVWIYFTEGAVRAASEHGISAGLALLEIALSLLLFAACVGHIRTRLRRVASHS
jgi:uncharacterized membrane protein